MTADEFRAVLDELSDGWARRDYAAVAGKFAGDVHYGDPLRYAFRDRAGLQAFFEADEGHEQHTTWHTVVFDEAQQAGAAEYKYDGTDRYHSVMLVRVRDGKITHWREYQQVDPRGWEEFVSGTAFLGREGPLVN